MPEQSSPKHPVDIALGEAIRVARLRLDLLQEQIGLAMGAATAAAAQRAVGHSTPAITLKVYAHVVASTPAVSTLSDAKAQATKV